MPSFGPFGGSSTDGGFDSYSEFAPVNIPEPGPFLESGAILSGDEHIEVHALERRLFEERGVYDMTFGYNLAKLNLDRRHPEAGYRYAIDGDMLLAEFTPTTAFCPQSGVLTKASFRAWNGLSDHHEYDVVKIAIAPMHQSASQLNVELEALAAEFLKTGTVPDTE